MKLTWLLVSVIIAAFSFADAQDSRAAKIGTITIPAGQMTAPFEQQHAPRSSGTAIPVALRSGLAPPAEQRYVQKPPLPQSPKTIAGTSGPLPPSEQGADHKIQEQITTPLPGTLDLTATVSEAWWKNEVDNDRDGYKQSACLCWDPDVVGSSGSLDVYEKIYYKVSTSRMWALATVTATHTIVGASGTDAYFLQINGAPHELYDWRIDIYRVGQLTPDNSRDPSLDPDLDNYALEYPEEDATVTIFNAWWINELDCDGDGYKSSARLVWDPDVVGSTGSLKVHESIWLKYHTDQTWTLVSTTAAHTISGNSSDDQYYHDFTPFGSGHNLYDLRIDISREDAATPDYSCRPDNNVDLNGYSIESAREDGLRAMIADVWWSGNVDNDGDGYAQSTWLHWDADVVGALGYLLVDCRISGKPSGSGQWEAKVDHWIVLNGNTAADAESLRISAMPHGLYDWKIEVYSDWNGAPDIARQPSNDPLLGSFALELPEEDGTTAIDETPAQLPQEYALFQNYPNPFNPRTGVRYQVSGVSGAGNEARGTRVRLSVYDLLGREVAVLVDERKAPGTYEVSFDGSGLASGVYLCRMNAGSFIASKQMLLLK